MFNALTANLKASKYVKKKHINQVKKQIKETCENGGLHTVINFNMDEITVDELKLIKKYLTEKYYHVSFIVANEHAAMDIDWENISINNCFKLNTI